MEKNMHFPLMSQAYLHFNTGKSSCLLSFYSRSPKDKFHYFFLVPPAQVKVFIYSMKYLNIHVSKTCYVYQMMYPTDFSDPLAFPLVPPGWLFLNENSQQLMDEYMNMNTVIRSKFLFVPNFCLWPYTCKTNGIPITLRCTFSLVLISQCCLLIPQSKMVNTPAKHFYC